jgi:hypothetical protein
VKDIQAVVRQITASVTFLPLLEDPCEHSHKQQLASQPASSVCTVASPCGMHKLDLALWLGSQPP